MSVDEGRLREMAETWIRRAEFLRKLPGGYDYYKREVIRLESCASQLENALGEQDGL